MDVLVTGATGRIGANTVKHLLEVGHRVRAVLRPGERWRREAARDERRNGGGRSAGP